MSKTLEKVFKENGIEGVVFDLDSTLVDTYHWLYQQYKEVGILIVDYIRENYKKRLDIDTVAESYWQSELLEYKIGNVNFVTRFPATVARILSAVNLQDIVDANEIVNLFTNDVALIYTRAPRAYEGTLELIKNLQFTKISICTHSGKDWTDIKVNSLIQEYKTKYDNNPTNIYPHAIDINNPKDYKEWTKAAETINSKPQNLIAVGDSFTADIIPSAEAGYKYIVWITEDGKDKEEDLKQLEILGHKTAIIKHIKDLEELLTSNQLFQDI